MPIRLKMMTIAIRGAGSSVSQKYAIITLPMNSSRINRNLPCWIR